MNGGVDRAEFDHLGAEGGDKAPVRGAAAGRGLGVAAGDRFDAGGHGVEQGARFGEERQAGQGPAKRPASNPNLGLNPSPNPTTLSRRDDSTSSFSTSRTDAESVEEENEGVRSEGGRRVGLGLSPSSRNKQSPSQQSAKQGVRGFEGSSLNSINGEDITAPGVSTSVIADDLEVLLRKFVQADRRTRRELLVLARKYYDELDINFPNVSK